MFTNIKKFKILLLLPSMFAPIFSKDWSNLPSLAKTYGPRGVGLYLPFKSTSELPLDYLEKNDIEPEVKKEIIPNQKNPYKNIGKSIASLAMSPINIFMYDMGIGNNQKQEFSFYSNIKTGLRLFAYHKVLAIATSKFLFSATKNIDLKSSPPQLPYIPSFCDAAIIAPIVEELIFTHSLGAMANFMGGPLAAQVVVPTIFGLMHSHQNPHLDSFVKFHAGLGSFLAMRNFYAHPNNYFASIITHMTNNTIAHIFLSLTATKKS